MTPSARCQTAIELLDKIDSSNAAADEIFNKYFRARRYAGGGDRRAVRVLVYKILRKRSQIDWWCERLELGRTSRHRALTTLALEDSPWPDITSYAAFQKEKFGPAPLSINEWRAAERAGGQTLDHDDQPVAVKSNIPVWMESMFCQEINDSFVIEINALNMEAETDLRINSLRSTREAVLAFLREEGIECQATPFAPHGIRLNVRRSFGSLKSFRDGDFEPQGEASQLAVELLGLKAGQTVLDLCAGSGGKSLAAAACMRNRGRLILSDVNSGKLSRAKKRLKRAGVTIAEYRPLESIIGPKDLVKNRLIDVAIIDAPCTGSGVWRRNPEAKWRLTPDILKRHVDRQRDLLRFAATTVRPGGMIAYMTCSVLNKENRDLIDDFLAEFGGAFRLHPLAEEWRRVTGRVLKCGTMDLQLTPGAYGMDGFYVAVMEKTRA